MPYHFPDIHTHIGLASDFNLSEEDVLYSMKAYNIDYSIISNIDAVEYYPDLTEIPIEMQKSQFECLNDCIKIARKNPNKLGVAFWFKPHTERLTQEIKDTVKANLDIIKALKLHPYYSKTSTDSPEVEEYLRFAEELNLPIIIHTAKPHMSHNKLNLRKLLCCVIYSDRFCLLTAASMDYYR